MGFHVLSSLEESILKRTVHVSNLPVQLAEEDVSELFAAFGSVNSVRIDKCPNQDLNMALIEFVDSTSANDALSRARINCAAHVLVVKPSQITIDVIPPTDVVFGKPMTVGRHVMAVNHSMSTTAQRLKRETAMRSVKKAAVQILQNISKRIDHPIPDEEIEALKSN